MKPRVRRVLAMIGATLLALSSLYGGAAGAQERKKPELLVFAAVSLTDVLGELSASWERASGVAVRLSFAASSVLARQIEAGGQAEIFISADQEWMDYLATRKLIDASSRRNLAGNRLVIIAPADSTVALSIGPGFPIAESLAGGRLATGDPDTVPAGRYARDALTTLGVWDQVSGRLVPAENVRAALAYVARGEAPLGIVYSTDARIEKKVRVVGTFPDNSSAAITYPAAAIVGAGPSASGYLAYLAGANAAVIWNKHGFRELSK